MSSPDRGEVWLVDLGYVAKVRPPEQMVEVEGILLFWLGFEKTDTEEDRVVNTLKRFPLIQRAFNRAY